MNKKEKEQIKQDKEQHRDSLAKVLIGSLVIAAMGVLLLLLPLYSFATMVTVLGWVLTVGGVVGIIFSVLSWGVSGMDELLGAVIALAFGIVILCFPWIVTYIFGVVMCLQIIFQAFGALGQSFAMKKTGLSTLPNLILTALMVVLGVIMLCYPMITARWLLQVLGGFMVATAIANLVIRTVSAAKLHKVRKAVIDADD